MSGCDMTERETLEFAARAAGVELKYDTYGQSDNAERVYCYWNPLVDDAEAFQLAASLSMRVDFCNKSGCAARYGIDCESVIYVGIGAGNDLLKASRYAITRAAAEIGKRIG